MEHDIAAGKHDKDSWNFDLDAVAGKPRKRKEMSYRDQFTDGEFVKMCEDGIDDEEMKSASKSPEESNHGKRKRDEDEDFVDATAVAEDEEFGNDNDASRRERRMPCYYYRKVYDAAIKLKDPSGRLRSDLYMEKPSAMDYPDYYTIVKEPMSITMPRTEQFEGDFNLMVGNAQLYNHPESLVVFNALEIDKCVKTKMKPLHLKTMEQVVAAYEKAEKDYKRRSKSRKDKKKLRH